MPLLPRQPERVLFWIVSVAALVALVAWLRPPADTFLWKSFFDAGHAVVSGYLALVFLRLFVAWNGHVRATRFDYLLAFVITMACGLGIEIVQIILPRDADFGDLVRNLLGSSALLLAAWACDRDPEGSFRHPWLLRTVVLTTSALLFMLAFVSVGRVAANYAQRDRAFPRLCDFDASWERQFVRLWETRLDRVPRPAAWAPGAGSAPPGAPSAGPGSTARGARPDAGVDPATTIDTVARITFQPATYPGFTFKEPKPDWRGHRDFVFEVYSDLPTPVEIVLRIDDVAHNQQYTDRFNRTLTVAPGANTFRIPLVDVRSAPQGREMDMRRIAKFLVFAVDPPTPFSLFLNGFRLE